MRMLKTCLLGAVMTTISGCGYIGAGVTNGPQCPYQGVHLDLYSITDWETIKSTYGLVIPLAIVDLPFSFVFDTLVIDKADGGDKCPRNFSSQG